MHPLSVYNTIPCMPVIDNVEWTTPESGNVALMKILHVTRSQLELAATGSIAD
jgi:hypothetical protein